MRIPHFFCVRANQGFPIWGPWWVGVEGVLLLFTIVLVNVMIGTRIRRTIGIRLLGNIVGSAHFRSFRGFIFTNSGLILLRISKRAAAVTVSSVRGVAFNPCRTAGDIRGIRLTSIIVCRGNSGYMVAYSRSVHSMVVFSLSNHVLRFRAARGNLLRCDIPIRSFISNICLIAIRAKHNTAAGGIIVG